MHPVYALNVLKSDAETETNDKNPHKKLFTAPTIHAFFVGQEFFVGENYYLTPFNQFESGLVLDHVGV